MIKLTIKSLALTDVLPSAVSALTAMVVGVVLGATALTAVAAATPGQIPKPPGANPGDRGYEKVTPADKGGADVGGVFYQAKALAASGGGELLFASGTAFADAPSAAFPSFYYAKRGADAWSVKSALPASRSTFVQWVGRGGGRTANVLYVNDSLSTEIVETPAPIAPGTIDGVPSLYRRDKADGSTQLLTPGGPGLLLGVAGPLSFGLNMAPTFQTATPDGSHVLFTSAWVYPDESELSTYNPDDFARVGGGEMLYESVNGKVRLVGKLPNGDPALYAYPGSQMLSTHNAISDDGSRIYFMVADGNQTLGNSGTLYLNDHGVATEVAASSSAFVTATSDGRFAVYMKDGHVYRYDADAGTSELLSGVGNVLATLGVSDDLSSVYFTADGDVIPGESPSDAPAIYLWHNGSLTHVATLADDRDDPNTGPGSGAYTSVPNLSAWVSQGFMAWTPDGKSLVFDTSARVTGYDAGGFREVYRYDADTDVVSCLSCPEGEATADAVLNPRLQLLGLYARPLGPTGNITTDGRRVFFESGDPLVGDDTNGRSDVYVWESGQRHLISDGKTGSDARFVAASADGDDAFLATAAPLVGADTDSLVDIYDARIGGGVADAATPAPPCSGDGCQGPTGSQPPPPSAGTVSFAGAGNLPEPSRSTDLVAGKVTAKKPKTVRGSVATLQVRVPGKGRIRASGSGLHETQKAAAKAGTSSVRVQLSQLAKRTLARKHRVQVRVTVRFTPENGRAQQVRVPVTFTSAVPQSDTRKGR